MCRQSSVSRPGSIYLITLITVAAIVSMVLIGVKLRSATNSQSALIEQMSESSASVIDAAEYAIETINADAEWAKSAKSGIVFSSFALDNSVYSGTVIDADTSKIPEDNTSTYRITVAASHETVSSSASFDLLVSSVDYVSILESLGASHYWPMNEASGASEALDGVGTYPGAYTSKTVSGSGTNDEGALVPVFADTSEYIEMPWGNNFKKSNGSFAFWMNLTNTSKFAATSVLGMLYQSGGQASINISIWKCGLTTYISEDGSFSFSNFATSADDTITPNKWHHIVMTWGSDGLYAYIDGVEQAHNASNTDGLATARANKGGELPIHFGGGYLLMPTSHSELGFEGSLAHMAFLPVQLTAKQAAELAAIKPDLTELSLVEDSWVRVFE